MRCYWVGPTYRYSKVEAHQVHGFRQACFVPELPCDDSAAQWRAFLDARRAMFALWVWILLNPASAAFLLVPHQPELIWGEIKSFKFQQYAEVFNVRYKSIHFKGWGALGSLIIAWFEHQECWENETTDSPCVNALSKVCILPPFDVPSGSFIYATI